MSKSVSIDIKDIYREPERFALEGKISVSGWVRTNRTSKEFGFIELNDGTYFKSLQVVYEKKHIDDFEEVAKIRIAVALNVEGYIELTPESSQPFELKLRKIVIEADSEADYPLQKKRHSMEFLREIAHLRPRSNTFSAVFRVRSILAFSIHKFFNEKGFIYIHTPIITGNDAEGAGEMFRVTTLDLENPERCIDSGVIDYSKDFFGKETSLTVSGQLEAEVFALAFKKVYTFGPTFRAENSNTARHASEFWMIEPEVAFADIHDDMDLAEDMVKYLIRYVIENAREEMEFFNSFVDKELIERLNTIMNSDFARITYSEAIEMLEKSNKEFQYPIKWGIDLQTEHERYITEEIFGRPVFVCDYPKDIKAFYMRLNDDGRTVAAMDLLVPGVGEIIGGSQREERFDKIIERMEELGMDEAEYRWYLDLRRYGGAKHAGFGLGFERMLMYITGMSNIRDVIPFPRTPRNAEF